MEKKEYGKKRLDDRVTFTAASVNATFKILFCELTQRLIGVVRRSTTWHVSEPSSFWMQIKHNMSSYLNDSTG